VQRAGLQGAGLLGYVINMPKNLCKSSGNDELLAAARMQ